MIVPTMVRILTLLALVFSHSLLQAATAKPDALMLPYGVGTAAQDEIRARIGRPPTVAGPGIMNGEEVEVFLYGTTPDRENIEFDTLWYFF